MNTAPQSPVQGGDLAWQLICVADALDALNQEHAFLTTLYQITACNCDAMEDDARHLLYAYLDKNPRQQLTELSDQLMAVARSMRDRR